MQHSRQDGDIELEDYVGPRYSGLDGYRRLVSLASEREVLKRGMGAGEIRAALIAQDEEARAAAQDEAAHG